MTFWKKVLPVDIVPSWSMGASIPRLIHQTYPTRNLPSELAENVRLLQALNPGWEHRLYDDHDIETFVRDVFGDAMLAWYRKIDCAYGAARADLFRYLIIYRYGGVYLDIKSSITRPLDEIIGPDDRMIISHWPNRPGEPFENWGRWSELIDANARGEVQQWHIIAAPGHLAIGAVIRRVLRNLSQYNEKIVGVGQEGVVRVTGPIPYSLEVFPHIGTEGVRLIENAQIGLVYSILDGERAHRPLFRTHYTGQIRPIVRPTLIPRIVKRAGRWARHPRDPAATL
jgi:inositol phosphorylceramide mannosyltransferase catalytic subunit